MIHEKQDILKKAPTGRRLIARSTAPWPNGVRSHNTGRTSVVQRGNVAYNGAPLHEYCVPPKRCGYIDMNLKID